MFNKRGNLWAAVVNDQYPADYAVNYYTNVDAWRGRLPVTIETWIKEKNITYQKLVVNYKSKK